MSEKKFSRPPWRVSNHPHIIEDSGGYIVAMTTTEARSMDACEVNARLIAAAPDLLAACEMAVDLSRFAAALHWDGSPNTPEFLADLANKIEAFQPIARAAIAKAVPGREP